MNADRAERQPAPAAPEHVPHGPAWLRRHPVLWLTVAALALRFLLFLGRGDYVAFDEGWYLLLATSLAEGEGYRLAGLRHVTLSPLFPILAAGASFLVDDPVRAGRLVAGLTSGLLVVPCWHLFRSLAGERLALWGCALVVVMPSLVPFVVPFWVGWDLWVGAEPVLHLFLYTGLALAVAATRRGGWRWPTAGVALGLAYLARPEAILVTGALGLALLVGAALRSRRWAAGAVALALGFALAAAPYWLYLHDATGHWSLTGRGVATPTLASGPTRDDDTGTRDAAGASRRPGSARVIEEMLWADEDAPYILHLYGLDPSGTRLRSDYWGIQEARESPAATAPGEANPEAGRRPDAPGEAGPEQARQRQAPQAADPPGRAPEAAAARGAGFLAGPLRYLSALRVGVPLLLWPFVLAGMLAPRRRSLWPEILVTGPILVTSLAIAVVVAVDPRTQLFLVPLMAFYAARGIRLAGVAMDRSRQLGLRRGFLAGIALVVAVVVLLGIDARRLYMSLAVGSPHHVVAAENRAAGAALDAILPPDAAVMSWHPALALYAGRDWRVLPYAPFDRIVRYADAIDSEFMVLSLYYPAPDLIENAPEEYMTLRLAPGAAAAEAWDVDLTGRTGNMVVGWVRPR